MDSVRDGMLISLLIPILFLFSPRLRFSNLFSAYYISEKCATFCIQREHSSAEYHIRMLA
uniref:Uncharacterized protein n=1 Tax=Octopus bimaculoides TaxID=37653 RepID=A0A0L8HEX9_OCTBM